MREHKILVTNMRELYLRGSFRDLVTYQREVKRVLSPYEYNGVIQGFDSWLASLDMAKLEVIDS